MVIATCIRRLLAGPCPAVVLALCLSCKTDAGDQDSTCAACCECVIGCSIDPNSPGPMAARISGMITGECLDCTQLCSDGLDIGPQCLPPLEVERAAPCERAEPADDSFACDGDCTDVAGDLSAGQRCVNDGQDACACKYSTAGGSAWTLTACDEMCSGDGHCELDRGRGLASDDENTINLARCVCGAGP